MADLTRRVADLEERLKRLENQQTTKDAEWGYKLNKISAHDAWQDSEADNVASGFPLVLKLYIPENNDTRHIQQVLLSVWLEAFRSYGTGALSQNLGTISISTNTSSQSSATTTGPSATTTSGPSSTSVTSENSHQHTLGDYPTDDADGTVGMHYHHIPIDTTWATGSHSHGMDHTHEIPSHTHSLSHTHAIDHSHTLGSHAHDLVHGIYVGTTASGCTIILNGTDRTNALVGAVSFSGDQLNLDITQYVDRGLNTIQITSATLGRIRAMFFASLYLNMGR